MSLESKFDRENPEAFIELIDSINLDTLEYIPSTYLSLYNYLLMKIFLCHDFRQDILLKLKTHSEESLKYYKLFNIRTMEYFLLSDDYFEIKFDDPILDPMVEYSMLERNITLKTFNQFKDNIIALYQRLLAMEFDNPFYNLMGLKYKIYDTHIKYLDPTLPESPSILLFPVIKQISELPLHEIQEYIEKHPALRNKFINKLNRNLLAKNPTPENAMIYFNSPLKYDGYVDNHIQDNVIFEKITRRNFISGTLRLNKNLDWYSFTVELSKSINVPSYMREQNKADLDQLYSFNLGGEHYLDRCKHIVSSEERISIITYGRAIIDNMVLIHNLREYEAVLILYNQNKIFIDYFLKRMNKKLELITMSDVLLRSAFQCNQLNSTKDIDTILENLKIDDSSSKMLSQAEEHFKVFKAQLISLIERVKVKGFNIFNTADEADQVKFLTDVDDQKCCIICLSSLESISTIIQCGKCKMNVGHLKCLTDTWHHARNTKCPYCRQ
jgi:hypothetical protein